MGVPRSIDVRIVQVLVSLSAVYIPLWKRIVTGITTEPLRYAQVEIN